MLKKISVSGWLICLIALFPAISQSRLADDNEIAFDNYDLRNNESIRETIDFDHIDFERIDNIIFKLTNEIRVKHKLKPLSYAPELANSAKMHATDMVKGNFFSHINEKDEKKRTPNDRAKLSNIANPFLSENLIEGYGLKYTSYETVFLRGKGKFSNTSEGELITAHTYLSFCEEQLQRWMNSTEHRKNILSKDALQMGCGASKFNNSDFNEMPSFYVVQNFQCYQPLKKINP